MATPSSLLRGARAFARDQAREAMAPGYLWDVVDYVPLIIDSVLTGRGAWIWGSDVGASADFNAGLLAPFTSGEQTLASASGSLYLVSPSSPYGLTNRGGVPATSKQNPVMLFDECLWLDGSGAQAPTLVRDSGSPTVITAANVPKVTLGTVWGEYFVGANQPGHEDTVYWSPPDDVTLAWDANSFWRTATAVTGIAALRTVVLVFHASSVERLRGSRPPAGTDKGDMILEPLFNQVGTTEPKTICYWQETIVFADEHGVHVTDGAVLRNLVQQGGIQSYWRTLYNNKQSLSATVFLDYYIVSIIRTDGITDTLVCDLNQRQWFRLSNIAALSMFASGGTVGMERIWAGIKGTNRLARLGPCFFPSEITLVRDANGTDVLPYLETPWYKLAPEGRKRVRFAYASYDVRTPTPGNVLQLAYILNPQDTSWTVAGTLPSTNGYTRFRLPVGKAPYGVAFQLKQINPSIVTRLSDIAVDAHAIERGRV